MANLFYFTWRLLFLTSASALVGYDCGRSATNITTVSLREVGTCEIENTAPDVMEIDMQLLQLIEHKMVQVTMCRVKIERHIRKCGMFSHQSDVKYGETTFFLDIKKDVCVDLQKYGKFPYERVLLDNIMSNSTSRRTVTLAGTLSENGDCSGTSYVSNEIEYENVVVTAKLEIDVYDDLAAAKPEKNEIIFPSGTRCSYDQGKCIDAENRHLFWEYSPDSQCNYEKYVLLFDGRGVKVGNDSATNRNVYFGNSTENIQFGLIKTDEFSFCGYKVIRTDHPKLFITEYGRGKGIPAKETLQVQDILLTAYFNTKIAFLDKHMKTQFTMLYNDIIMHRCRLERQIIQNSLLHMYTKPDIAALTIMNKPGFLAVPAGEVAYLIPCEETICSVRYVEECFQEIPVTCRNESYFLKPHSRIMTKSGTPRDCNHILPSMFSIEELWFKFSPTPREGKVPQILKPLTTPTWRYQDIKGLMEGGIYTPKDLERLREHTMFPVERQALLEEVARRLSDRSSSSTSANFQNLIDRASVEAYAESKLTKLWDSFTKFGIFFSGVMGIITIFTLLKLVGDTLINGFTLHSIYGWSIHLLGALWSSMTHLLITLARKRKDAERYQTTQINEVSTASAPYPEQTMNADIPSSSNEMERKLYNYFQIETGL